MSHMSFRQKHLGSQKCNNCGQFHSDQLEIQKHLKNISVYKFKDFYHGKFNNHNQTKTLKFNQIKTKDINNKKNSNSNLKNHSNNNQIIEKTKPNHQSLIYRNTKKNNIYSKNQLKGVNFEVSSIQNQTIEVSSLQKSSFWKNFSKQSNSYQFEYENQKIQTQIRQDQKQKLKYKDYKNKVVHKQLKCLKKLTDIQSSIQTINHPTLKRDQINQNYKVKICQKEDDIDQKITKYKIQVQQKTVIQRNKQKSTYNSQSIVQKVPLSDNFSDFQTQQTVQNQFIELFQINSFHYKNKIDKINKSHKGIQIRPISQIQKLKYPSEVNNQKQTHNKSNWQNQSIINSNIYFKQTQTNPFQNRKNYYKIYQANTKMLQKIQPNIQVSINSKDQSNSKNSNQKNSNYVKNSFWDNRCCGGILQNQHRIDQQTQTFEFQILTQNWK